MTSKHRTVVTRTSRTLGSGALALGLLAAAAPAPAEAEGTDESAAWEHVRTLRRALEGVGDGETEEVDFVQTFVPAGFSTGDRESGRMSVSVRCLRWDYDVPYEKSFLVCGDRAYLWNAGESEGRRFEIDPQNEPGLDLIRLRVEELAARYDAEVVHSGDDFVEIELTPHADTAHPARDARLTLDPRSERLTSVTYRDAEGNTTRFELTGHRPGAAAAFEPPNLDWREE